jgi:hypothetical protein
MTFQRFARTLSRVSRRHRRQLRAGFPTSPRSSTAMASPTNTIATATQSTTSTRGLDSLHHSDRTLAPHNQSSCTASASPLSSADLPTTTATMPITGYLGTTLRSWSLGTTRVATPLLEHQAGPMPTLISLSLLQYHHHKVVRWMR